MPTLRTLSAKTLQWNLFGRCGGGTTAAIRRAFAVHQSRQWLAPEQVREIQLRKLNVLLRHATAKVPYYRHLHRHGHLPDHVSDGSELARTPLLTKREIQEDPEAFLTEGPDRPELLERRSGGSTGNVLQFFVSPPALAKTVGAELWGDSLAGYQPGDPAVSLWGTHFDDPPRRTFRQRLSLYLANRETLITDRMDDRLLDDICDRIEAHRPTVLTGYVSALVELAHHLRRQDRRLRFPSRSVIAAAEPLSESNRLLLEEAIGRPVFNRYGAREVGLIAMECDHKRGLHLNCEDLWVDLAPAPDAPPGAALVVATKLNEFGMPLIRYAIGDYAGTEVVRCSCGRGYPTLTEVRGRVISRLCKKDGSVVAGEVLIALLDYQPVRQYKVTQERDYSVTILVVPDAGFNEERIAALLRSVVGDLALRIERTNSIPLTPSGKLLPIVSHVASESH